MAAALAERASGQEWEDLLGSLIFEPFGMADAGFGWPSGEAAPYGHLNRDGSVLPIAPEDSFRFPVWLVPAGDLHASTADMGSFMQQYLKSWSDEPALISHEAAEALFTPGIKSAPGWGIQSFNGHERVAVHEGSAETFTMMIAIFPDADRGVVVAANGADPDTRRTIIGVLRKLAPTAPDDGP